MNFPAGIKVVLILAALASASGCSSNVGPAVYKEVSRVKSPDSRYDAVLISIRHDVLGNNDHLLYIVPSGRVFNEKDSAFNRSYLTIRCFKGLEITWREKQLLEIGFEQALIDDYRNCANVTENIESPTVIELRLAPRAPSALPEPCPCGK
jgi:hypothetical protein